MVITDAAMSKRRAKDVPPRRFDCTNQELTLTEPVKSNFVRHGTRHTEFRPVFLSRHGILLPGASICCFASL